MTTETRSPNDMAQALIAQHGLADAQGWANRRAEAWADQQATHPTRSSARHAAFWRDVATLLRLETQDDENEAEQTERWDATFDTGSTEGHFVPGEAEAEDAYDEALCTHGAGPEG